MPPSISHMATSPFEVSPHALGCPWEPLSQFGLPNVNWCEETLCAWIAEPANTWSNLGYLITAGVMAFILRKRPSQNPVLKAFPLAAVGVGLASGIYHASVTWALQILDFVGMYFFLFLPITVHALRRNWFQEHRFKVVYLGAVALVTLLTTLLSRIAFPIQSIVLVSVLLILTLEMSAFRDTKKQQRRYPIRWFLAALLSFTGAFGASLADVTRLSCDPQAHGWFAQGHAIWHWLTALGLTLLLPHYLEVEAFDSKQK